MCMFCVDFIQARKRYRRLEPLVGDERARQALARLIAEQDEAIARLHPTTRPTSKTGHFMGEGT